MPDLEKYDTSEVAGVDAAFIGSYEDAIQEFAGDIVVANDMELVQDKETLVGQPFLITNVVFRVDSATGRDYVSVEAVTPESRKIVFNDGSTGVFAQLQTHAANGRTGGIMCRNGLRFSEYGVDKNGKPLAKGSTEKPDSLARTYYLN